MILKKQEIAERGSHNDRIDGWMGSGVAGLLCRRVVNFEFYAKMRMYFHIHISIALK